jgi:hypothetical protein
MGRAGEFTHKCVECGARIWAPDRRHLELRCYDCRGEGDGDALDDLDLEVEPKASPIRAVAARWNDGDAPLSSDDF